MTTPFCGQLSGEYHLHTVWGIEIKTAAQGCGFYLVLTLKY
jgi:hypothetical protein